MTDIRRIACLTLSVAAVLAIAWPIASEAQAQGGPVTAAKKSPAAQQPVQQAQAQPKLGIPNAESLIAMVRGSLLTLNDALQTGNFTVLRDVGAPGFREANTAGRLAQVFVPLAAQRVDLLPVAVIPPQLTEAPALDAERALLRIKGVFPGQPVQIAFDLLYQPVGGRWRLFGISVNAVPAVASAATAPPPAQPGGNKK